MTTQLFQPLIDQNKMIGWSNGKLEQFRDGIDLKAECTASNFFGHRVQLLKSVGVMAAEFWVDFATVIPSTIAAPAVRLPVLMCAGKPAEGGTNEVTEVKEPTCCEKYKEKTDLLSAKNIWLLVRRILAVVAGIFTTLFIGIFSVSAALKIQEKLQLIKVRADDKSKDDEVNSDETALNNGQNLNSNKNEEVNSGPTDPELQSAKA
jgi:hypothetical protein